MEQEKNAITPDAAETFAVVSSTECTGLIPAAPDGEAEVESYQHLYDVPLSKRQIRHSEHEPSPFDDGHKKRDEHAK